MPDPLLFTVANLTQFGGGARIAPHACADDGLLELVAARRQDAPELLDNIPRLFDGTLNVLPQVILRSFRTMIVRREKASPIHIDGEIVEAGAEVRFRVEPAALRVLVPVEKTTN
jgi:diacylglycerol kinase family enzyme